MFTDIKFMTAFFLLVLLVIVFSFLFDLFFNEMEETRPSYFLIFVCVFNVIVILNFTFVLLSYFISHFSDWLC